MSLYVDHTFIAQVGSRLERFKRKSERLYNFRCPFCGDSSKSKTKARAYFYRKGNDMFFRCHNCNEGMSLGTFLKRIDPRMYEEYVFERYTKGENGHSNYKKPEFTFNFKRPGESSTTEEADVSASSFRRESTILDGYDSIADLPNGHFAKEYVVSRQIPSDFHESIYFVPDFKALVDEAVQEHEYELRPNDKRLVIPFYDEHKRIIALQGRSFEKTGLRYITIKVVEDAPKIFGLDRVDKNKRVYVVEGPIDSMFLPNSIATAGAALDDRTLADFGDLVFVYDNEKRNKAIVEAMIHAADRGHKVVVWPDELRLKDINDMILDGRTSEEVISMIDEHIYSGLQARIAITQWRRC